MTMPMAVTRRTEIILLAAILALALAPRIWCFARNTIPEGDAGNYLEVGRNLALGRGFTTYAKWDFYGEPAPIIHPEGNRQPLLPLVAAATFKAGAKDANAARVVSLIVSLAALALLYALIKRWLGAPVALAAAALLAIEPAFLWFSIRVQTEAYFILWFAAALLAAGDLEADRPSKIRPLAVGILLALSYLTRTNGALLLIAYAAALIIAYRGKGLVPAALALVAFAAAATPWWIRNYQVFGDPLYTQNKYFLFAPTFDDVWSFHRSIPTWQGFVNYYGLAGLALKWLRGLWRAAEPFFLGNLHFQEPYQGAPLAAFAAAAFFAAPLLKRRRALLFPGLALALSAAAFALYGQGLYRYFLPFYLLLIPLGLAGAWRAAELVSAKPRWVKVAFAAVLLAPWARPLGKTLMQDDRPAYANIRAAVDWIKEYTPPNAVVVTWPRVIGFLYQYDRPTLYWPSGELYQTLFVLHQYNAAYVVVEPTTLKLRPSLEAVWFYGPNGLEKVSPSEAEGQPELLRGDYGSAAFREVFRTPKGDLAIYEIRMDRLRGCLFGYIEESKSEPGPL